MDPIWLPATLVLALGLVWATLDAWWTRRRRRLDRERRRQALPAGPATAPAALPAARGVDREAVRPTPAPAARAAPPPREPAPRRRADEARESDLPA